MNLSEIVKRAGKFTQDNSPAIFTALAVAGSISTAYLTGRATFKYMKVLAEKEENFYDYSAKRHLEQSWKLFLPAAGSAVSTIAFIIAANRIGSRRSAALAAAYAISEKAFDEYKAKVLERMGPNKERAVRDEVAQEQVNRSPIDQTVIIGDGSVLCFERWTGRYFLSDMETLKKAQNDLNYRVLNDYYASLTDFYNLVGLPRTEMSDEFGWNSDKLLELDFSTVLSEGGKPCLSVGFAATPIRGFYRVN